MNPVNESLRPLPLEARDALDRPYVVSGERAYVIGQQNGAFPDMGEHIEGEMGGVWMHPIKVLDGVWLAVDGTWLTAASTFRIGPYWADHEYELDDLRIVRHEWVPDGEPAAIVRYSFLSNRHQTVSIRFLARTDLRGVWSLDPVRPKSQHDIPTFVDDLGAWWCRDDSGEWNVVVGAPGRLAQGHESGPALWGPETTLGDGVSVALEYELDLRQGEQAEIEFVIAGSEEGPDPAMAAYHRVSGGLTGHAGAKANRYRAMLSRSTLDIPDPSIARAWDWIKCNYDWLVRAVPRWERGLGAGVPDYPWWFGTDSAYAIRGCLALGQPEIAIDTLDLVRRLSLEANGDSGRVIHEANTWGTTTNPGNTQETPHFTRAVWDTLRWTGDREFLERNYSFCKAGLLGWTLGEQCLDGDLLPYGYGITEMYGLNLQCIDTAALTVDALSALAGMADVMEDADAAARCRDLRDRVRLRMDDAFWMETEGLYGDIVGTPVEMIPRFRRWLEECQDTNPDAAATFRALIDEAESASDRHAKRPWLLKNWSVICPLEDGLTDPDRAQRVLRRAEGPEFTGPWGVYICGTYRTAMMSIGTGVLATSEVCYGRADEALSYVRLLTDTLEMQMPGAIAEMSPDYGCFVQAWSGYAVAWPIVAGVFGVHPDAFKREVVLTPSFPADWDHARLLNVRIGTNSIDLSWDGKTLSVVSREPGWRVTCDAVPCQVEIHPESLSADD